MDPMTFATIVSLLADFNSSRQANKATTVDEFNAWLATNRHEDAMRALTQNASTLTSIKALLHDDRDTLDARLSALDVALAQLASGIDAFRDLARATHPESELSEQAVAILKHLEDTQSSKFLVTHYIGGLNLICLDGAGRTIPVTDKRFLDDDLVALVDMGFLLPGHNSKGERLFTIRRAAAQFLKLR
jgi:hypothetical protein